MTSEAEKELNRIERELNAKEKPPGKPPVKQGGWVGSNDGKPKNQSLDAVVVGALLRCCLWNDYCRAMRVLTCPQRCGAAVVGQHG